MKISVKYAVTGALSGAANGFFGAGGGLFLVPLLISWCGMEQKRAFATSVAVIFPLCAVSAVIYWLKGGLPIAQAVPYLLGGAAGLDKRAYSGFIGQVSGTGTNTCVSLPERLIGKLGSSEERGMIINMEAGLYTGIPRGSFDLMLDSASNNPGLKAFEKLTAGVYLGQLCRLMLIAAADEGLISRAAGEGAAQYCKEETH